MVEPLYMAEVKLIGSNYYIWKHDEGQHRGRPATIEEVKEVLKLGESTEEAGSGTVT